MTEHDLELDIDLMKPKLYKVILHNDDYSTFDFVIQILMEIFNKANDEAINLTLKIDREGSAVVGIYPFDIAETKVNMVKWMAEKQGFPLLATIEEDN
jgi:ATP-dependent Clp protease adaptor protein ClpS